MNTYQIKLKHILPTFLSITFITVTGLALIRWLFIAFPIIDLKEEIWQLWIPMIFPWIPITIWLRPKLRILTFKSRIDNRRSFFQFITWMMMGAMLFNSQSYLTTATGKLEKLRNIKEADRKQKVRFYKLTEFAVAPYFGASYSDIRTVGRYNENLSITIFFVTPILSDTAEKITSVPKYWYGVKFSDRISNRISNEEKEGKYNSFFNECVAKMNRYDFHSLDHFESLGRSDDKDFFLKAIESRIKQPANENFVILEPVSEPYGLRNGNTFAWIFGSFGIGLFIFLISLTWPGNDAVEYERQLAGKKPEKDDVIEMLNYLIPKEGHFVTSIILDLNILVFLVMVLSGINIISPNALELLQWGGNRRPEVLNGEWWRLLTNMFLHGGIMHLLLNIGGLVFAAIFIEPVFSRGRYFLLYILSGLIASLSSIWWHEHTVSVGASGAIFGLYGAILGLLLTNAFKKETKKGILIIIGFYVGINLIWGLTGGIDNAAHIGGLLSGAVIGVLLYKRKPGKKN